MDFQELQNKVRKTADRYRKHKVKIDRDFALMKLYEEAGELTQAVLIANKKSRPQKYISAKHAKNQVAKEMADVLGVLIVNAHLWNIDLEKAIKKKWISKLKK